MHTDTVRYEVITPKGLRVMCRTLEDLLALEHALGGNGRPSSPVKTNQAPPAAVRRSTPAAVVKILKTLRDAGDDGVTTERFVKVLGLKRREQLGTAMVTVNRSLKAIGVDPSLVLLTRETSNGKVRFAGPAIEEALENLK